MNSLGRENPFTRRSIFNTLVQNSTSRRTNNINSRIESLEYTSSRVSMVREKPYAKSNNEPTYDRRNYESENKNNQSNFKYYGTFFPLSRYENRKKLRELDTEIWRREKQQQERYKLEHYGSQALRYSSYSTDHSSMHAYSYSSPKKYLKPTNQNEIRRVQQKRQQYETPRNEYMLYFDKETENRNQNKFKNQGYESSKLMDKNIGGQRYEKIQYVQYNLSSNKKYETPNQNAGPVCGIQRKETPYFNTNHQYFDDDLKQNLYDRYFQNHGLSPMRKEGSFGQYGSGDEEYYVKPFSKNDKNFGKTYGSSHSRQGQKLYDSDYINQDDDESDRKGPLNQMKFSSSFQSQVQQTKEYKLSSFGPRRSKFPENIRYDGRQFYKIDLII